MDWLSKRKFVIVCHEKVVEIPLEEEKHGVHLKLVLEVLRKEKMYAKERVKPRRVRAIAMTIQYGVRGMILAAQSEAFKQENVPLEGSEIDEAHASRYLVHPGADKTYYNLGDMYCLRYLSENEIESPWILSVNFQGQSNNSKEWNSGDDQLRLRWMIYLVVLADAAESVRDTIGFEYCLASSSGWTNIRCAPFEALYGRKCKSPVLWAEFGESNLIGLKLVQETIDKVVVIKEKLQAVIDRQKSYADNRCKPLEFDVGDRVLLKKCLADASLHVLLDEIKVDKTLRFVKEPVEIMDREREDYMKSKYPQLFIDRTGDSTS
ncbi:hypothetical protein Tco_1198232 [Tanacetum coccineum]